MCGKWNEKRDEDQMQTTLCPFVCSCRRRRRRYRAVRPMRLVHANQAPSISRIATFSVNANFCCEPFQEIRGPGAITPMPGHLWIFVRRQYEWQKRRLYEWMSVERKMMCWESGARQLLENTSTYKLLKITQSDKLFSRFFFFLSSCFVFFAFFRNPNGNT